jgi:hypothetical protein
MHLLSTVAIKIFEILKILNDVLSIVTNSMANSSAQFNISLNIFSSTIKCLQKIKVEFRDIVKTQTDEDLQNKAYSNQIRIILIKFSDMVESQNSFTLNKYLDMLNENFMILKDLPLCTESKPGRFSNEDKPNVSIPSALEPVLYELWPRLINLLHNVCSRVLFSEHLGEYLLEYERAMSKRRTEYLDAEFKKQVEELEYINYDFDLWNSSRLEIKSKVVKYLQKSQKPKFYTEHVGVNLLNFFLRISDASPEFFLRGDRFEED